MSSPIKRLVGFAAVLLAGFWILALLSFRTRVRTGGADLAMEFLARSPLGPLPAGATNVLFHSWSGPITGETWLRFELPPGDLAKFIADSPALAGIEPKETYDREHPLLPFPVEIYTNASVDFGGLEIHPEARFHIRNQSDPDWYVTTIVGQGRMYFLWPNAWLHLDEERGIVWLKVVKG